MQPVVYTPPPAAPQEPIPVVPAAPQNDYPELKLPENDYRFFQYSRLALPILLFALGCFTVLILLTMWQSRSDIRYLKAGVPRQFQLTGQKDAYSEAGISKGRRNVRIAAFFIGVTFSAATIIVYFTDMPPVLRARINYPLGLILILDSVLCWIAFALDLNRERDAIWCNDVPHQTVVCQSREDLGTGCTVFDAFHALFLLVSGILVVSYTYTGDWCRETETAENYDADLIYNQSYKPMLIRNGVSTVRRTLTILALISCLITGIILCIFTILVNEVRSSTILKDAWNRSYDSTQPKLPFTNPGWPLKCTKLRYSACSLAILCILFNLVPLTSRVIAYVLGFLYLITVIMTYTVFGLDVAAIEDAKKLPCPTGYACTYDSFNSTIVFDFISATVLVLYILWEYFISKRPKAVPSAAELAPQ